MKTRSVVGGAASGARRSALRAGVLALVAFAFAGRSGAAGVTPYVADANTIILDHLDGSTSATIKAYSYQGSNPEPVATPNYAWVAGPSGLDQALELSPPTGEPAGSATYIEYPPDWPLSVPNGTIEFWVCTASWGISLVDQGDYYGSGFGWTFGMGIGADGVVNAGAWEAFNMTSTAKVPLNQWTHLAVTWGGTGAKIYMNGVQIASDANTGQPATGYSAVLMVRAGSHKTTNRIDELRVSNVQRTEFNLAPPAGKPVFESEAFYGTSADELGTAVTVADGAVFVTGGGGYDRATPAWSGTNDPARICRYAIPLADGAVPVWDAIWPSSAPHYDQFRGIAGGPDSVYIVGTSDSQTLDGVGGKESKGFVLKYPFAGAAPTWYSWYRNLGGGTAGEWLECAVVAEEAGSTYVYAGGMAQYGNKAMIVKVLDPGGSGPPEGTAGTEDFAPVQPGWPQFMADPYDTYGITMLNGYAYAVGHDSEDGTARPILAKYDPDGVQQWVKRGATQYPFSGCFSAVAAFDGALYAVGERRIGVGGSLDFLVEKWDEAGTLQWSRQYDRGALADVLFGVVGVGSGVGGRVYAVGFTEAGTAGARDGVVLEIDPATGDLLSTTLWGGAADDIFRGVATDGIDLYAVGDTESAGAGGKDMALVRFTFPPDPLSDIGTVLTPVSNGSLAWGDYDGDGDLDLAVSGQDGGGALHANIYENDGGVFTDSGAVLTGVHVSSMAWGDYDNDGDLDLAVAGNNAVPQSPAGRTSKIYRNDGGGTFFDISATASLVGVGEGGNPSLAWGDFDNDGDLDIAIAGWAGSASSRIYRNDGADTFVDIVAGLEGMQACSVAWGDYDGDGDLDLVQAGRTNGSSSSRVYRNNGDGTFTDAVAGLPGAAYCSTAWADFDGDGDLDLALSGQNMPAVSKFSAVYENVAGALTDVTAGMVGVNGSALAWGDYDNDGDPDLALTGIDEGGVFYGKLYRNDGGGAFTDTGAGLPEVQGGSVAWGDYDGDGDLDLAVLGSDAAGNPITRIYRNNIAVVNTPPAAPTGLSESVSAGDVTFSWLASTDTETPDASLSYNLRVGTTPGGDEISASHADSVSGWRMIPAMGNANGNVSWTLTLPAGTYHWSVQAVDSGLAGSPWADEESFSVIQVTYPNGGEILNRGEDWTITWDPTGAGGNVKIEIGHMGTDPVLEPLGEWTGVTDEAGTFCPTARQDHTAVWTGSQMIVWGGIDAVGRSDRGAVYDPATDTWKSLTATGGFCPSPRQDHTAVWTGSQMTVWGGLSDSGSEDTGGAYDPGMDVWESPTDTAGAECPSARRAHSAVWTGARMIVWGGDEPPKTNSGAVYDPTADTWEAATSLAGLCPTARGTHSAVWTGTRMIVWGGYPVTDTGAVYDSGGNTWESETSTDPGVPSARYAHTAVWTGSRMIVWGGTPTTPAGLNTGAIYDVATDTWETATSTGAAVPTERYAHSAVWTGTRMIVWSGNDGSGPYTNTGAFYNPPGWHTLTVVAASTPDDGSFTVPASVTQDIWVGTEYRVRITHLTEAATDDSDLDFAIAVPPPPTFSVHPAGASVNEGQTAAFSVTASGSGTLSYQWERSDDGGVIWNDIGGATLSSYTTPATVPTDDGAMFRCVVTNAGGSVTSNPATLTVISLFTDSGQALGSNNTVSVALGDIDGDGDLDCVEGNNGADLVWINDGTGAFTDSAQALGSSYTMSVALGDVDGDGDLDCVAGNYPAQANLVWLNDGTGQFTDSGQELGTGNTWFVALGDVDGDGDLDFVAGNEGQPNRVWLNDGTGAFTDSGQALGTSNTFAVVLGDVDGDGDLDCVAGNFPGQANRVWLNDGAGTFTDSGQELGSSDTYSLVLGDIDGDGDLDCVAVNYGEANRVWLNDGTGGFTDSAQALGSSLTVCVALGDVDGDGDLDMVTGNNVNQANRVWLNDGTGGFTDSGQALGDSGTWGVALGDIDGDGDLDCVAGNQASANRVWRNNSAVANTAPSTPGGLSESVSGLAPADVAFSWGASTDTETPDISLSYNLRVGTTPGGDEVSASHADSASGWRMIPAMGNANGNVSWTLTLPGGTYFWSVQAVDSGLAGSAWAGEETFDVFELFTDTGQTLGSSDTIPLALGDVDGDGDIDCLAGNPFQANRVWLNDGGGGFTDSGQALGSSITYGVALGDVDGDGDLDCVEGNCNSQANRVWLNNGTGTFTDSGQALGSSSTCPVALGDLDGDGDLDLAVGNSHGHADRVWLNNGSGTFTDSGQALGSAWTSSVALGDVDGDGDLDFVAADQNGANLLWLNDGTGTFTLGQALGSSITWSVAFGDVDGDGDLDCVAGNDGANLVWINDGAGSFTDSGQTLGSSLTLAVPLGDVDGDGDLDCLAGNYAQAHRVWLNDGTGTFTDSGQAMGSSSTYSVALGDIDDDGDLDCVAGNYSSQPNRVWRNNSVVANTVPSTPGGLASTVDASDVTFSWNASTDAETPDISLSYNLRVGTTPGGDEVSASHADSATGWRMIPAMGNANGNVSWTLTLPAGTYWWSVQAVDSGLAGSAWAAEETFSVLTVTYPNGGETLMRGQDWTITWDPTGAGGNVAIEIGHMGTDPVLEPEGEWTGVTDEAGAFCPSGRSCVAAVWTGTRMIVWGGFRDDSGPLKSGAVYDPETDTWERATSETGLCPSERHVHSAAWTGSRMIVWGGSGPVNTGAIYDPATDTWESATSTGGFCPTARWQHSAVWTGTRMIVWGGYDGASSFGDGAVYDPALNTWESATSSAGTYPGARYGHSAVWTGSRMIVWGASDNVGYVYDPAIPTWEGTISTGGACPAALGGHVGVWTGSRMIVWGGGDVNTGAIYDPATDTWETTTSTGAGVPPAACSACGVWTGTRMIVWGGHHGVPNAEHPNGALYNPPGWHTLTVVAASTPDDGSFTVPASTTKDIWVGTEYRVRITHLTEAATDDSDADFTIADTPNTPPVAVADAYATDEETLLTVAAPGVLTNDSDPESDPITAILVSDVTSGWLWLGADGSFTYTPVLNFAGSDSFTYMANDGSADSNTVTVAITVNNLNDAPTVATPIPPQFATEDSPFSYTFPVSTFDDVDAGDSLTYAATLDDDSPLPVWLGFTGATRTFSGTPLNADVGTISVKVTATDAGGPASISDIFTVTVANTNDAPTVAIPIPDQGATEDAAFSYTFPANTFDDDDLIHGDVLTYSATLEGGSMLPTWLSFDPATREFSGTPLNDDVGVISVEVTATDTSLASAADIFTITVANTNDPPVANDDAGATPAETAVVIDVIANDTDVDVGDTLSVKSASFTQGTDGTVSDSGGGTLTYEPTAGFSGTDTFTYVATDGVADSNTATVTVIVTTAGAFPPVTAFTATARGEERIDLAWTNPPDPGFAGVVVFRSEAAITFLPVDGDTYAVGTVDGVTDCVYDGTGQGVFDRGLSPATQYCYAVHAYQLDPTPVYSNGAYADATTTATTPPTVILFTPGDGAAGVLLTARITVTFSEPMDTGVAPETVLSVRLDAVDAPGVISWSADGTAVAFAPGAPLEESATYTVAVQTTAADEAGNALAGVETYTFTTRAPARGIFGGGGCSPRAGPHDPARTAGTVLPFALLVLAFLVRRRKGTEKDNYWNRR